jgi:hypothetical protein
MRAPFPGSMIMVVIAAAAASVVAPVSVTSASAQTPAASGTAPTPAPALMTPWGEPDLQGIWTDETNTPLERPAKYAIQEFFGTGSKDIRSPRSRLEWCAGSAQLRLSAYIRLGGQDNINFGLLPPHFARCFGPGRKRARRRG